jgi:hypothetical protein
MRPTSPRTWTGGLIVVRKVPRTASALRGTRTWSVEDIIPCDQGRRQADGHLPGGEQQLGGAQATSSDVNVINYVYKGMTAIMMMLACSLVADTTHQRQRHADGGLKIKEFGVSREYKTTKAKDWFAMATAKALAKKVYDNSIAIVLRGFPNLALRS